MKDIKKLTAWPPHEEKDRGAIIEMYKQLLNDMSPELQEKYALKIKDMMAAAEVIVRVVKDKNINV